METSRAPTTNEPQPPWWAAVGPMFVLVILTSPCWGLWMVVTVVPKLAAWANRVPFDSDKWKDADPPQDRYDMTWDLLHGSVLRDKSGDEVGELLGKPDSSETMRAGTLPMFHGDGAKPGTEVWYYNLGGEKYEPGLGPSGAMLGVEFCEGNVTRVRKIVH